MIIVSSLVRTANDVFSFNKNQHVVSKLRSELCAVIRRPWMAAGVLCISGVTAVSVSNKVRRGETDLVKKILLICTILLLSVNMITITYGSDYEIANIYFPIGESFYFVNGIKYHMDAVSYYTTNSAMVPLRYLVEAINSVVKSNDKLSIQWHNITKTATIYINSLENLQFTAGESNAFLNGSPFPMLTQDNQLAIAEIKGNLGHERIYIPLKSFITDMSFPFRYTNTESQIAIYFTTIQS